MEVISEDGDDLFQEDDAEEPQSPMSPVTPRLPAWLKKHRMSNYGEALRNFGVQSVEDIGYLTDSHLMSLGLSTVQLQKLRHLVAEHNKGRWFTGIQICEDDFSAMSPTNATPQSPATMQMGSDDAHLSPRSPVIHKLTQEDAAPAHDYKIGTIVEFTEDINDIEYGHWGKQLLVCVAHKGDRGVVRAVEVDGSSQHIDLWGKEIIRVQGYTFEGTVKCVASQIREVDVASDAIPHVLGPDGVPEERHCRSCCGGF